jgi:hypothetical protein
LYVFFDLFFFLSDLFDHSSPFWIMALVNHTPVSIVSRGLGAQKDLGVLAYKCPCQLLNVRLPLKWGVFTEGLR